MVVGEASELMVAASNAAGRETEALLRLTVRANDALTADDIYEPALDALLELLHVERGSILLFDDDDVMRFKAWRGLSEEYRCSVEGHSPWPRGTKDAVAICTPDVELDPALVSYVALFRREQIRSLAFIPLVSRGELLGKFMAYSASARSFDERELALAQAVAVQVAQACARARLIEAERSARELAERSADRMQRLLRVTSNLSNALFAEQIATTVIDEGTLALDARSGGIWLLRDDKLRLLRHRGYAEQAVERVRTIALDEPVPVARTALLGQAIWLESLADYERAFPSFARFTASLPTHNTELAIAALPLTIQGRVIGALGITFVGRRSFGEPERAFLMLLAQHCAQGLERARLYEEAQRAERRSHFLAQVSGLLASSLEQQEAMRDLAGLVVPKVADWCLVTLLASDGSVTAAALKHVDPEMTARAEQVRARSYAREQPGILGTYRVLQTGIAELHARLREQGSKVLALDNENVQWIDALGAKSAMIVPIRAQGRTFGAITFVSADETRTFDHADLAVAVQVGERAGVAVHNADLYQRAVNAVELRDEFLSVAGHELRTPLTALLLQAQSLARSSSISSSSSSSGGEELLDPARVRLGAERLTRNATRLSKLVDELLDVTRITSGRLQLSRESLDLGELVDEVIQGANEQIERARTSVRCNVAESVRGVWDRHRLEQVAMNLLSNALKYGGEQPIDVGLRRADDHAVLSVRDYGIGVSEADQRRIFGRFERAVSTRNFGGLGLGLWIAREIVEAHGGTISVRSERGKGAEFTVRLPIQQS